MKRDIRVGGYRGTARVTKMRVGYDIVIRVPFMLKVSTEAVLDELGESLVKEERDASNMET